jgi:hypothetical protein
LIRDTELVGIRTESFDTPTEFFGLIGILMSSLCNLIARPFLTGAMSVAEHFSFENCFTSAGGDCLMLQYRED